MSAVALAAVCVLVAAPPVLAQTETLTLTPQVYAVAREVYAQGYQPERWYRWYQEIGTWRPVRIGTLTVGLEDSGADFILPLRVYQLFKLTLVYPTPRWNPDTGERVPLGDAVLYLDSVPLTLKQVAVWVWRYAAHGRVVIDAASALEGTLHNTLVLEQEGRRR